eukprot:585184-Alexandrium_andersonii.AAC.1
MMCEHGARCHSYVLVRERVRVRERACIASHRGLRERVQQCRNKGPCDFDGPRTTTEERRSTGWDTGGRVGDL